MYDHDHIYLCFNLLSPGSRVPSFCDIPNLQEQPLRPQQNFFPTFFSFGLQHQLNVKSESSPTWSQQQQNVKQTLKLTSNNGWPDMLHSLLDSAHCSEHGGLQDKALSIWTCLVTSGLSNLFHTAEGKTWCLFLVSFDNVFISFVTCSYISVLYHYTIYTIIYIYIYIHWNCIFMPFIYHNNPAENLRPSAILWLDALVGKCRWFTGESRNGAWRGVLGAGQIVLVVQDLFIYLRWQHYIKKMVWVCLVNLKYNIFIIYIYTCTKLYVNIHII